jgi:hypothetical protein
MAFPLRDRRILALSGRGRPQKPTLNRINDGRVALAVLVAAESEDDSGRDSGILLMTNWGGRSRLNPSQGLHGKIALNALEKQNSALRRVTMPQGQWVFGLFERPPSPLAASAGDSATCREGIPTVPIPSSLATDVAILTSRISQEKHRANIAWD